MRTLLGTLLSLLVLVGLPVGSSAPATATAPPLVLVISVDGFNPAALSRTSTPNLHRLIRYGASTLNARSAYEQTNTLPNHVGMVTGRRIEGSTGHHVTWNYDNGGTIQGAAGHYVASIFDVAHDRGISTSLFTSKTKFRVINRSYDASHGRADTVGVDNGRDKIGTFSLTTPGPLTDRVVAQLSTAPRPLTFWHISSPDDAGHQYGFMSARYLAAVRRVDGYVGRVLHLLDTHPALKSRMRIVLTADHGGQGASHRDPTKYYNYRVPLIVWGRGVAIGQNLYRLNTSRRDPGTVRRTYVGTQPIRNTDVANLALASLGLPIVVDYSTLRTLRVR